MRRIWTVMALLALSWSIAGCDAGGGDTPPSPDESKQALEVVKKANRGPMMNKGQAKGATETKN
jgi:hypothetical protein